MKKLFLIPLLFLVSCSIFKPKQNDKISLAKYNVTLMGTSWVLDTIVGFTSEGLEQSPTMTFTPNNEVYGFGGCNYYNGKYAQNEKVLAFSKILSTKKYCYSGSKTETQLTALLINTSALSLDNKNRLVLLQDNKPLAVFHQVKYLGDGK